MTRSDILTRPLFTAGMVYLFTMGATFGMYAPDIGLSVVVLLAITAGFWLVRHGRGGWHWHRTPLDLALLLWAGAIGIAFVANLADARQMLIGIWYMLTYVLVWYFLSDWLANRRLTRAVLVDAVLITGVLLLLVGYVQVGMAVINGQQYDGLFGLPRPGSFLGNPNKLAAMLLVMVGFAAGRWTDVQRPALRLVYSLYLLASLLLLLLTFSRGGWIGGATALVVTGVLWLANRELLSMAKLRSTWAGLSQTQRRIIYGAAGLVLIVGGVVFIVLLRSFDEAGRSAYLRTYIWDAALAMFAEQPLTGHGLFTFGSGLQRLASMPPLTPHSHAHSFPLQVLAELGIPGAVALLVSIWLGVRAMIATQRELVHSPDRRDRAAVTGGIAAVIGFGVHHLFDTPMMTASIALGGIIAVAVAVAPVHPVSMVWRWRRIGHALAMAAVTVIVLLTGWWSSRLHADYIRIVAATLRDETYRDGADQLQRIVDADPDLMIYAWQQGMLYGMDAAITGSPDSIQAAITAFERAAALEPDNPVLRANLAGLRWQQGDTAAALVDFALASDLAPQSWQLAVIRGTHASLNGDTGQMCAAYQQAIDLEADASLHPAIITAVDQCPLDITGIQDRLSEAAVLYLAAQSPPDEPAEAPRTVEGLVLQALLALAAGDRDQAVQAYQAAEARSLTENNRQQRWLQLAQAQLTGSGLDDLRAGLPPALTEADYVAGGNIGTSLYLREVVPRQFLPQAGYETDDPLFQRVLLDLTTGTFPVISPS